VVENAPGRRTVAGLVVCLLVAASSPGAAASPVVLRQVAIDAGVPAGVRVTLSAGVVPYTKELPRTEAQLQRLYMDFPGVVLAPTAHREVQGSGVVRRVRVGQFDAGTARVVVELAAATPYAVREEGGTVTLSFATPATAALAAEPDLDARPDVEPPPQRAPRPAAVPRERPAAMARPGTQREPAGRPVERDWRELLARYAADERAFERGATPAMRAALADALQAAGLAERARQVAAGAAGAARLRLARAEAALQMGDVIDARTAVTALRTADLDESSRQALARIRTRLALAGGDLAAAQSALGERPDAALVAEIAGAALAAGAAAQDAESWDDAKDAYRRVLDLDAEPAQREAAAAGLVRSAAATGDTEARDAGLAVLRQADDPLLVRAARAMAGGSETGGRGGRAP